MKHSEKIAICSMAGVLPGARDLAQFWHNIIHNVDASTKVLPTRWLLDKELVISGAAGLKADCAVSDRGYFIDEFTVDPSSLNTEPTLPSELDPLARLTLELVSKAFFSAAHQHIDKSRTGLIIGNILLPTAGSSQLMREQLIATLEEALLHRPAQPSLRNPHDQFPAALYAGLAAKALGLGAGSFTLDAACSSSLYALYLAAQKLKSGEADAMIAGGVCLADSLYTQIGFSQLGALSKSGVCRPLDQNGDGLLVGEGGGMFLLKRLSTALAHGDTIHGIIAGIGLSNDLKGALVAPSSEGQLRAMRAAYQHAGFGPDDVQLIECHATGTPLGDKVELSSIAELVGPALARKTPLILGGVKGNVGHLLTAAGSASLIKVLLSIQNKTLPPTANFSAPLLDKASLPGEVLTKPRPWSVREGETRRAAINGFGFGGTNAHMLIEEYDGSTASLPPPEVVKAGAATKVAVIGIELKTALHENFGEFYQELTADRAPLRHSLAPRWWGAERSSWLQDLFRDAPIPTVCGLSEISIQVGSLRIPPVELRQMLPQQLLMLLVAQRALAACHIKATEKPHAGVFIGARLDDNTNNYHARWGLEKRAPNWLRELTPPLSASAANEWKTQLKDLICPPLNADRTLGSLGAITASRIARELRLGGAGYTVSCEENSGMQALMLGIDAILHGDMDLAIVGAVDFASSLGYVVARERIRHAMLEGAASPRYLDGAVALVLMDEAKARSEGHPIYATFDSASGTSQGGVTGRLTDSDDDMGAATTLYRWIEDLAQQNADNGTKRHMKSYDSADGNSRSLAWRRVDPIKSSALATVNKDADAVIVIPVGETTFDLTDLNSNGDLPLLRDEVLQTSSNTPKLLNNDDITPISVDRLNHENTQVAYELIHMTEPLLEAMKTTHDKTVAAHAAYMEQTAAGAEAIYQALSEQMQLIQHLLPSTTVISQAVAPTPASFKPIDIYKTVERAKPLADNAQRPLYDYEKCREFARGSISAVLGSYYAAIDDFPTRVRLPDEPLLLCHRIMSIEGRPLSMTSGRIVTQHDVKPAAFYLDDGLIPISIAVEAGQADLFLSAYLGVDFKTKGRAVYRLLDAIVTFHQELPGAGSMIEYDIKINEFITQGNTYMFRFEFDATTAGQPLMSMRQGVAGFFSSEELKSGKGVIGALVHQQAPRGKSIEPATPMLRETYDDAALDRLRHGDYAGCFGSAFAGLNIDDPKGIPGEKMRLVHRIKELDPTGGRYQIGKIVGEADIHPDDWFLTCHFIDDQVMPGTLMYECCFHTLRVFLLRMGWVGSRQQLSCQPLTGEKARLKCRGQVLATTAKVTYEIHLREIGYAPTAYAKADALMYADDKLIVEITGMTLTHPGYTQECVEKIWQARSPAVSLPIGHHVTDEPHSLVEVPHHTQDGACGQHDEKTTEPLFTTHQIRAFACGKPSDAFGAPYARFDDGAHFIARLPSDPYLFLHRVLAVQNVTAMAMVEGGMIETAYDVSPEDWYFAAENNGKMPFAILNEIALQACGFMAAYMGSALPSKKPLYFRNLSGSSKLTQHVPRAKVTLITKARCKSIVQSHDMILQRYEFITKNEHGGEIYRGETQFGYFTKESLAAQVGIRKHDPVLAAAQHAPLEEAMRRLPQQGMPEAPILMLDELMTYQPAGGYQQLGYLKARKKVNPREWFFAAHFFQDPVMPGSLGLEAFVQLLKVYAIKLWGDERGTMAVELLPSSQHDWLYRGQVIPEAGMVEVEAEITAVDHDKHQLRASGALWIDDLCIYQMKDFAVTGIVSTTT